MSCRSWQAVAKHGSEQAGSGVLPQLPEPTFE